MLFFSGALKSLCSLFRRPGSKIQAPFIGHDVGEFTYGEPDILSWGGDSNLTIGRYCSIAPGVKIFLGGEHRTDWVSTFPFTALFEEAKGIPGHPASKGDVVIGHDVWIGEGVAILSGVTIGNGAVIGARSVVAKDVPAYGVAVGNPARTIKLRFDDESIARLQDIAWWDWPMSKVKVAWPLLMSSDIKSFIETYKEP